MRFFTGIPTHILTRTATLLLLLTSLTAVTALPLGGRAPQRQVANHRSSESSSTTVGTSPTSAGIAADAAAADAAGASSSHQTLHLLPRQGPLGKIPSTLAPAARTVWDKLTKNLRPKRDTTLLYSGFYNNVDGPTKWVKQIATDYAKRHGRVTLSHQLVGESKIWIPKGKDQKTLMDFASLLLAQRASGVVKVLVGDVVRQDSTYKRVELPALLNNNAVTKVVEINLLRKTEKVVKGS